jgi:stage III sporulation protein AE
LPWVLWSTVVVWAVWSLLPLGAPGEAGWWLAGAPGGARYLVPGAPPCGPRPAWAAEPEAWPAGPGDLDLREVETFVRRLDEAAGDAVPTLSFEDLVAGLAGGTGTWSPGELLAGLARYLGRELVAGGRLLGQLVMLAVVCAVLQQLAGAFERAAVARTAHAVCFLALAVLALHSFRVALDVGRQAVEDMAGFVQALLPVLLTLVTAAGGAAAAALLHPLVLAGVTAVATTVKAVVFPLLFLAALLGLAGHLAEGFPVTRLAGLMRGAALGVLGLAGTVFLGLLMVHGVGGAVAGGLALSAAKFAADTFVPLVGGVFADALQAMVGSSRIMKHAVGAAGMLVLLLLTLFPALKLLGLVWIYKLAGALVQPLGERRVADCLGHLGDSFLYFFAAVAVAGLAFFFGLAIVVAVGDLAALWR